MDRTNDQKQAELEKEFDRFDTDKSGEINVREFQELLRALGDEAPDETLLLQFAAIDADDDGAVRIQEFIDWWLDKR